MKRPELSDQLYSRVVTRDWVCVSFERAPVGLLKDSVLATAPHGCGEQVPRARSRFQWQAVVLSGPPRVLSLPGRQVLH